MNRMSSSLKLLLSVFSIWSALMGTAFAKNCSVSVPNPVVYLGAMVYEKNTPVIERDVSVNITCDKRGVVYFNVLPHGKQIIVDKVSMSVEDENKTLEISRRENMDSDNKTLNFITSNIVEPEQTLTINFNLMIYPFFERAKRDVYDFDYSLDFNAGLINEG